MSDDYELEKALLVAEFGEPTRRNGSNFVWRRNQAVISVAWPGGEGLSWRVIYGYPWGIWFPSSFSDSIERLRRWHKWVGLR